MKHLVIADAQCKPDVSLDHLKWLGQYIMDKRPDVIINIGDFADMESLSSYDKGTKSFEGRRYKKDIAATKEGMDLLLGPMREYNAKCRRNKDKQYKPRMVLTLGNHEERIMRAVNNSPELDGVIGYHDLPYEDWEVIDFLEPINIDGILYVHYFANPNNGNPYGGNALNQLKLVGRSFCVGHKQTLDITTRYLPDGTQQWGFINGAFYQHQERYKGRQGNHHFRGVLLLNQVEDGNCCPCVVSLDYLKRKYS